MVAATVPAVYASALLEFADDRGERRQAVEDAVAVRAVLDAHPELLAALRAPELGRARGCELLRSVFAERVCASLDRLLALVVDRDRVDDLVAILDEVEAMAARSEGRIPIAVTTAVELDAGNRERLDALIRRRRGANVHITYAVDPAIIGGLRIQSPERVVDFTAARHLAEMKRTMQRAPLAAAWDA